MRCDRLYENSKQTNSDVPYTTYKIAYWMGGRSRVIQINAASPFLAFKQFQNRMSEAAFKKISVGEVTEMFSTTKKAI